MKSAFFVFFLSTTAIIPGVEDRLNFLIILADDCTYNNLLLYGGENAKTPNIDVLTNK